MFRALPIPHECIKELGAGFSARKHVQGLETIGAGVARKQMSRDSLDRGARASASASQRPRLCPKLLSSIVNHMLWHDNLFVMP